jgi:hypothetical protein
MCDGYKKQRKKKERKKERKKKRAEFLILKNASQRQR